VDLYTYAPESFAALSLLGPKVGREGGREGGRDGGREGRVDMIGRPRKRKG